LESGLDAVVMAHWRIVYGRYPHAHAESNADANTRA
jgi:hypothetical protein